MFTLERPWGRLGYRVAGDPRSPRLLYVHGSGGRLADIEPMLDRWAERFHLVAFDHRGMGTSDVPPAPYTMADVTDDVVALLDAVGWPTCRMLGVSYGGMVAQHVAARIPDRVERLVLACTSSGGAGMTIGPPGDGKNEPIAESVRLMVALAPLASGGPPGSLHGNVTLSTRTQLEESVESLLATRFTVPVL